MEEITEEKEKRIPIQAQLRFRKKKCREQKHEQKDIFGFSAKGMRHPISKLKENLLNLINSAYHGPTTESVKQKILLVGKSVKHKFQNDVTLEELSVLYQALLIFKRWLYSHASIGVVFSDLIIMNMLIAGTQGP